MARDAGYAMRDAGCESRDTGLAVLCMIALGCLLNVSASAAESFPLSFRAPTNLPKQAGDHLQSLAQQHADKMDQQISLHIRAVDRACGLSEEQRVKLELAAQGAVQDAVEEWLVPILSELSTGNEQNRQVLLARLGAGREAVIEVRGGGAIQVDRMVIVQQQAPRGFFAQLFGGGGARRSNELGLDESAVLRHPIFTGTLDSVLTEEQQEQLAEAEQEKRNILAEAERAEQKQRAEADAARDAARMQTRTARLVRKIASRLALEDAQLQQMTKVVEQVDVESVVRWRTSTSGVSSKDAAEFTLPHLPKQTMREILTPEQFSVWEEIVKQADRPAADEAEAVRGPAGF